MVDSRIIEVIRRVTDNHDLQIDKETQAFMVPGWDSMKHIEILLAIQDEYAIHIGPREVLRLKNVGDLQELIHAKLIKQV
jgi:acyl carrier protein